MVQMILASQSTIRAELLRRSGIPFRIESARIDEDAIKAALLAAGAQPRDIADALAEAKARKIAAKHPTELVLGCDQILACDGDLYSKPKTEKHAVSQLKALRGRTHHLFSAAVLYEDATPIWRHVGHVRLNMRDMSDATTEDYISRNWDSIRHSIGCYKLEEEGVRLFTRIDGDYFSVLGLPLLELLSYLTMRGILPS